MKNILLYRTIRPEIMGVVVSDIFDNFGDNIKLSVLTKPENIITMESIPGVNNCIVFSGNAFSVSDAIKNDVEQLQSSSSYEISIVPVSGHLDSYDNVIAFNKKYFNTKKLYYYCFPGKFFEYKSNPRKIIIKKSFHFLSLIFVVPMLFAFITGVLVDYIRFILKFQK